MPAGWSRARRRPPPGRRPWGHEPFRHRLHPGTSPSTSGCATSGGRGRRRGRVHGRARRFAASAMVEAHVRCDPMSHERSAARPSNRSSSTPGTDEASPAPRPRPRRSSQHPVAVAGRSHDGRARAPTIRAAWQRSPVHRTNRIPTGRGWPTESSGGSSRPRPRPRGSQARGRCGCTAWASPAVRPISRAWSFETEPAVVDHVVARPPVDRRRDLVVGGQLERVDDAEHLVEVPPRRHRVAAQP